MAPLRVRLLGDLRVEGAPGVLGRRQVRTLLKVLALGRGQPVAIDRLVDCLWPGAPPSRPGDQLSVLASRLRGALGGDRVPRTDGGYALVYDWLDLDALEAYAAEAQARLKTGTPAAAWVAASAGLSLVRGRLLADETDAWWVDAERAAAGRVVARLNQSAASAALATGDWVSAAELAAMVREGDPYDELALQVQMEALARSGRPGSALAAYVAARERLAEDLGVSPTEATEALHTAIVLEEVAAGAPVEAHPSRELAGRDDALRALDELLDRALLGRAQVAVVEGEAGIGKSRVVQVWSRRAAARGAQLVAVTCDELGRVLPMQPLLDAVDILVRRYSADAVLGTDLAVLGPLLGISPGPSGAAQLATLTDPGAGQALLLAALVGALRRGAERQPLVLTIENVHLADIATQAWLGLSAVRLAEARIVVVATHRTEEASRLPGLQRITLGPLDVAAAAEVVGPDRAAVLHARSGGHPLFLVELASASVGDELPSSIRDAVEERCNRAGPAAATLRAAAVIGPDVDLELLAAVTGAPPAVLLDHLEDGVRRRFLVEEGPAFVFAHALVREALAASVGASRAAFVHREAAHALRSRPGADALAIARHARLGGDRALASTMLVAASQVALTRFDPAEALRLLDEALALDDTAAARLERSRVHTMEGNFAEANEDLAMARAKGAGADALEVAAWLAHLQRRFGDALALADQGAREAGDVDLRTSCLALGGWVSLAVGDLDGAESRLEGALGQAPEASGRLTESWLGWLRASQGRAEETLRLVRPDPGRGLAAYRLPNAYALMAAAMAFGTIGQAGEALATAEALGVEVERMGARRWSPRARNLRAWVVRNLGQIAEADELNQAAVEESRTYELAEPLANGLLDLAAGRLMAGELDAARALLDETGGLGGADHAFRWRHQMRGRLLRARLDLARGEVGSAVRGAGALAADAARLGSPRYEVQARLVVATGARRLREKVDMEEVDALLARLDALAGVEAWWLTAEVAGAFGVDRWRDLAKRRVVALGERAGPYRERFLRAASSWSDVTA